MLKENFIQFENLDATLFSSTRRCPGAILCISRLIYVFASFHRRPTTIHWHEYCTNARTHARTHARTRIADYTRKYKYMHARTHARTQTHTYTHFDIHTHARICGHVCTQIPVWGIISIHTHGSCKYFFRNNWTLSFRFFSGCSLLRLSRSYSDHVQ